MKIYNALLQSFKVITITLLISKVSIAHQNHTVAENQYQQTKITDSLSVLTSKGGNIVVSQGEDGLLLVDNGYAELAPELTALLSDIESDNSLHYIINTHWHFDHTGGNDKLGKTATIIAHDNVRKRLANTSSIPFFNYQGEAHVKHALPMLTYPEAMRVHFNKDELLLEHFANSHTDGDTVVFFKNANLVHVGDLIFNLGFPFVDINNGGNAINYAKSIHNIYERINDKTVVIPGHGQITDKQGVKQYQIMLNATIVEVKKMKSNGLGLAAAQAKGLNIKWQDWGKGLINEETWIHFIYQSL